ncbi:MAG: PDZ domain-containing protein [Deltaproteobacteria bacterium]|nr:PDZ domain-containing protein [Deltaproteobacteria bacterium]
MTTQQPVQATGGAPRWVRGLMHLGLALAGAPIGLLGYHALGSNADPPLRVPGESTLEQAVSALGLGGSYELRALAILERDLYYVEQRYVEPERIQPDAMFQAALDRVEREQPEVLLGREPGGDRLHVSVGPWSTTLELDPLRNLRDVGEELRRVAAVLDERLDPAVSRPEIEYAMINGALSTLDPHTLLLPPEQAREMEIDNQGEFGGLGIELEARHGTLTIHQPIDGTPASKAGLQAGDQIVRIEDESTVNMDISDAVTRLRGQVGTPVRIQIKRKGRPDVFPVTIVRDRIKLNPVTSAMLPGGVGYVRIKSFNSNVAVDLEQQLSALGQASRGGLRGLVLDLRGNPGGYLNQAVEVADRFIDAGVLVATVEGATGRREEQAARSPGTEATYPIAVLVNGSSASASEIVAGAIRNLNRGVIIGERTYGKGSVQHLYENKDSSSLKLTVARYLTPGDQSIQSIGIPPDILLQPSILRPPAEGSPDKLPVISLYWREWAEREADLDRHLADEAQALPAPALRVRYLRAGNDDERVDLRAQDDWEVMFAREVVAAAPAADRVGLLKAAAEVVELRGRAEERAILEAFGRVGVDWRPGPNPEAPAVGIRLDLGPDGQLVAGVEEEISVEVVNLGAAPLHRVSVWTESANPWLDERELYIGALAPGQTRTVKQRVRVHDGYGEEVSEVLLHLRDPEVARLSTATSTVHVAAQALPAFAYTLRLIDDGTQGTRGDGDGEPAVGERVTLEVSVENIGEGEAVDGSVRLRNRAGRAVDIEAGSGRLGPLLDKRGAPCADAAAPAGGDCAPRLAPGQVAVVHLPVELRAAPTDEAWRFELQVGDGQRFDYTAVSKLGFYEYFQLEELLSLKPGAPLDGRRRAAPEIELSRRPPVETHDETAVLSGVVRDVDAVRDVMVFVGPEKMFYRGGDAQITTVPFTVDAALEPGLNHLVVLARDGAGLRSARSVSVWRAGTSHAGTASAQLSGSAAAPR